MIKLSEQLQKDCDYLIGTGWRHQIACERIGTKPATTLMHPIYDNRTPVEYLDKFFGLTLEQAREILLKAAEIERLTTEQYAKPPQPRSRERNLTAEQLDDAAFMRANGCSWAVIGKKYKLKASAIRMKVVRHQA